MKLFGNAAHLAVASGTGYLGPSRSNQGTGDLGRRLRSLNDASAGAPSIQAAGKQNMWDFCLGLTLCCTLNPPNKKFSLSL